MDTTKVKTHKRKGKTVSAHSRKLGSALKMVHTEGATQHGEKWKNKRHKAMSIAHKLKSGEISRKDLSHHVKSC